MAGKKNCLFFHLNKIHHTKLTAQHNFRIGSQPVLQNSGVHTSEIDFVNQIAIVEIGQVGRFVEDSFSVQSSACKKHHVRSAVVRSFARILFDAPSEFGESHHQRIV